MKRILLDTNIYGFLVVDPDRDKIKERLLNSGKYIVYGIALIRKELRDTPKGIKGPEGRLRIRLLQIYDEITKERTLSLTKGTENLAEAYYLAYKDFGGGSTRHEIMNDFMIVACASISKLDIVASHDHRTMLSPPSLKAYALTNRIKMAVTPRFIDYEQFKQELK